MRAVLDTFLKYWVQFICAAMAGALTALWHRVGANRKEEQKKQVAMEQALLALLRDRIYQACRYHLKNGYITTGDLEVLQGLNECYEHMGGNGTVRKLMQRIAKLEIRIEESH